MLRSVIAEILTVFDRAASFRTTISYWCGSGGGTQTTKRGASLGALVEWREEWASPTASDKRPTARTGAESRGITPQRL
jgi:hypothetical protein